MYAKTKIYYVFLFIWQDSCKVLAFIELKTKIKKLKPLKNYLQRLYPYYYEYLSIFHQLAVTYPLRFHIAHTLHLVFFVFGV